MKIHITKSTTALILVLTMLCAVSESSSIVSIVEHLIYMSAILYGLAGFIVVTILCGSCREYLTDLIRGYNRNQLIVLAKDGNFGLTQIVYICCGIFLIYNGSHFLAMSVFTYLIINRIIKLIVDNRVQGFKSY